MCFDNRFSKKQGIAFYPMFDVITSTSTKYEAKVVTSEIFGLQEVNMKVQIAPFRSTLKAIG
ncbi:MAG: hypothetical protein HKN87_03725 [Saprospiraceae bacterium]|nr:hypothetical protein [Saprospiraceae bacterium]